MQLNRKFKNEQTAEDRTNVLVSLLLSCAGIILLIWDVPITIPKFLSQTVFSHKDVMIIIQPISSIPFKENQERVSHPASYMYHGNRDEHQSRHIHFITFNPKQRREYIQQYGNLCTSSAKQSDSSGDLVHKYIQLEDWITNSKQNQHNVLLNQETIRQVEGVLLDLWKFCMLGNGHGTMYMEEIGLGVHPLKSIHYWLEDLEHNGNGVVELQMKGGDVDPEGNRQPGLLSSAVIVVQSSSGRQVANHMVDFIVHHQNFSPELIPMNATLARSRELYKLVNEAKRKNGKEWTSWKSSCHGSASANFEWNPRSICTQDGHSPCCHIRNSRGDLIMMLQHPFQASYKNQREEEEEGEDGEYYQIEDDQFISQIIVQDHTSTGRITPKESSYLHPRFFDILFENDCLPTHECHKCLKKMPIDPQTSHLTAITLSEQCEVCSDACSCYCHTLCKVQPPEHPTTKTCHVYVPRAQADSSRLIPKLIHQTWYEEVTAEKYPNFSRLVSSWKNSGWDYKMYSDDEAKDFLKHHFPLEVQEAYDTILPGAFKADLFRYCVLLIRGGIYADVDVQLNMDLDALLEGDIGFAVPIDAPGRDSENGSCVWNGLVAASPGHPFIARAIELVVNQIRNRMTSVDLDNMLCPDVVLQHSHFWDLLFVTGPCALGGAINSVLGRRLQHHIVPGELDILNSTGRMDGIILPGRTIIFDQNKEDMGSHRFTWLEKNVIVATTDMPDYDDRGNDKVHYSDKGGEKQIMFGLRNVYADLIPVREKIRVLVE